MIITARFSLVVPIGINPALNTMEIDDSFSVCPPVRSAQLNGSPLLNSYYSPLYCRYELLQSCRKTIGLYGNEGYQYVLKKGNIPFQIYKIHLWLFKCGVGFFTINMGVNGTDTNDLLDLLAALSAVRHDNTITYRQPTGRDSSEEKIFTIKSLIWNLLSLPDSNCLVQIDRTFHSAYCLFYGTGIPDEKNDVRIFLEMLRNNNKSNLTVSDADNEMLYSPLSYLTWAVSGRVVAGFADLHSAGSANNHFLTDAGGLSQSVFSNYLFIYLNALSVDIKLRNIEKEWNLFDSSAIYGAPPEGVRELYKIKNVPLLRLSNEDRITRLFDEYVCNRALHIQQELQYFANVDILRRLDELHEDVNHGFSALSSQMQSIETFMQNELFFELKRTKSDISEQIKSASDREESIISEFVAKQSDYINQKTSSMNDMISIEEKYLSAVFGETWNYLNPVTKASLRSAGVLWKSCSAITDSSFDFSGICISATSALELELKRCFLYGFQQYLLSTYKEPAFDTWPEAMLSYTKKQFEEEERKHKHPKLEKKDGKYFTMGTIPYLIGKKKDENMDAEQRKKLNTLLNEYFSVVLDPSCKGCEDLTKVFYSASGKDKKIVEQCEAVREKYRNPAAHSMTLSRNIAQECYFTIVGSTEAFEHSKKIISLLLQLYKRIDIKKLVALLKED